MSSKIGFCLILFAFYARSVVRSDELCADGLFDAITETKNESIVIFKGTNVWLFSNDSLSGPFPIKDVYNEMSGPIEAAVTMGIHPSVTDFKGASIYFEGEDFYTYKNFRPYQIEWGTLVYMPHKGLRSLIGSTEQEIGSLMSGKLVTAFFNQMDYTTNFVLSDSNVLSFTFELGYKYDRPKKSNVATYFSKYGLNGTQNIGLTAVMDKQKKKQLYLFKSDKYCVIDMTALWLSVECEWMSTKTLFKCESIVSQTQTQSIQKTELKSVTTFKTRQITVAKKPGSPPKFGPGAEHPNEPAKLTTITTTDSKAIPPVLSIISIVFLILFLKF